MSTLISEKPLDYMLYFKNTELAEAYHVSLRTVLNWIEAAKNNKLDLLLHEQKGKLYVANTTRNVTTIEELVEKRRKYRNTRSYKIVAPKPEFYNLFTERQIIDIISSIDIYHEIPERYSYFDGGANYWDEYVKRLAKEKVANQFNRTLKLLELNDSYLSDLISGYKKINVVDIGMGNSMPVRSFVERLLNKGVMGKYIALDISSTMLEISQTNMQEWFGNEVKFEGHQLDFSYESFPEILAREYIRNKDDVLNLILLLGSSSAPMRHPDEALQTVHDSMGKQDILIYTFKLDTPNSRQYFDFNNEPEKTRLAPMDRMMLDLLNIDESLYDVEMGFDEKLQQRYIRIRLKVALTINFAFSDGATSVKLNKEDTLLLWRAWHQTSLDVVKQFERNEFHPLQISQTEDKEYILIISKIKS